MVVALYTRVKSPNETDWAKVIQLLSFYMSQGQMFQHQIWKKKE